jgi:hypothetical protein
MQYAENGFGPNGLFLGYKAISLHLGRLTEGVAQLTEGAISTINKWVTSCTTRISLMFLRLRVEAVRQDFDVFKQSDHIRLHGAEGLAQKLQDIMAKSQQSSTEIDRLLPILTDPEPSQASASTSIELTAPELGLPPISTPVDPDYQNSTTTQEQPPKKDLLARKLDQFSDSSVSTVEVCMALNLIMRIPVCVPGFLQSLSLHQYMIS